MKRCRLPAVLLAVTAALLAVLALHSHRRLLHARAAAVAAAHDLTDCQLALAHIAQLQDRPLLAGSRKLELAEMARKVEAAAEAAGIPAGSVQRIWPQPPRRVGNAPYTDMATQVLITQVNLQQAITIQHALTSQNSGLNIKDLRLSAPRNEAPSELWAVELTVSYLLYDPEEPREPAGKTVSNPD